MADSLSFDTIKRAQTGLTPEQIAQQAVNSVSGNYPVETNRPNLSQLAKTIPKNTSVMGAAQNITPVTLPTSPNIPVDQISGAKPLNLAATIPDNTVDTAGALVEGVKAGQKSLQDYIKELQTPPTATEQEQSWIMSRIKQLLPGLGGQGKAQLQAEEQAGIPQLKQNLTNITSQILQQNAEFDKMVADQELTTGVPSSIVAGRQGAILRSKAAAIGIKQAQAEAMRGNLSMAQDMVNRAVDLQHQDKLDEINIQYKQLDLLQGMLDKEESIKAEALKRQYADQQAQIEAQKEQQKQVQSIMLSAAQYGADPNTLDSISKAPTVEEAIAAGSKFLGVEWANKLQQQQFENNLNQDQLAFNQYDANRNFDLRTAEFNLKANSDSRDTSWQEINGKKVLVDNQTGDVIASPSGTQGIDPLAQAAAQENISSINDLLGKLSSPTSVGVSANSAFRNFLVNPFSSKKNDFIAGIKQVTDQLTLDKLIQAKANGATFGALSDSERETLASAATRIGSWAVKDKNGNIVGYNTSGDSLKAELNKIANFAKLDYIKKGGSPDEVGVPKMPDGKYFLQFGDSMMEVEDSSSQILGPPNLFNKAGTASSANQVKGMTVKAQPLPYLTPSLNTPVKSGGNLVSNLLNKKFPAGSEGGQCGDFVRKIVTSLGANYPRLGDTLSSKIAAVQKYGTSISNAHIGSVIVTKENPTYGHVAYIIGKNAQGWIVGESNFKQSGKISYGRVIPYNSEKVIGVINPQA